MILTGLDVLLISLKHIQKAMSFHKLSPCKCVFKNSAHDHASERQGKHLRTLNEL